MTPTPVLLVAGARPNFIKVAPLYRAFASSGKFATTLVHTGQHYDEELSEVFFRDLALPRPDVSLGVGSGTHASQTARVLECFEPVVMEREPAVVVVVGDVNSTLACALATAKAVYPSGRRPRLAHVEAGLRSFDRSMPEEVNRVLTDAIADELFVTEEAGARNLEREGIPPERVFFVGNVIIDTLLANAKRAAERRVWERLGLAAGAYGVVTLHRPANVDDAETLSGLITVFDEIARRIPLVFPVHPRTAGRLRTLGIAGRGDVVMTPPMGYVDFLGLMSRARVVLTDSGGIQEETTVLGVPCLTLRESTERPVTVTQGTNTLVGRDPTRIRAALEDVLGGQGRRGRMPELWDGRAAGRIVEVLEGRR